MRQVRFASIPGIAACRALVEFSGVTFADTYKKSFFSP